MLVSYYKERSEKLDREMEYKVFGDSGKICLVFPAQNGRFYDFENFGMVEVARPWIDAGKLQLVLVDSIDWESWSGWDRNPRHRIEAQERWFSYVCEELLPTVQKRNPFDGKAMVTGCSMGACHSEIFYLRRPDLFDANISMSGLYNTRYFFGDYMDDLVYGNSPVDFLPNLPADHPYRKLYEEGTNIICVGQGPWENETLDGTRELDTVMKKAGIPAWFDYWGYDVAHDWNWWQIQFPYFLGKVLGDINN